MTFKSIAVNEGSSNFHRTKMLGLILKGKWVMPLWIFLVKLLYSKVQHTKEPVPWEYPWLRLLLWLIFFLLLTGFKYSSCSWCQNIGKKTAERFNDFYLLHHELNSFFPSFSCPSQDTIDLWLWLQIINIRQKKAWLCLKAYNGSNCFFTNTYSLNSLQGKHTSNLHASYQTKVCWSNPQCKHPLLSHKWSHLLWYTDFKVQTLGLNSALSLNSPDICNGHMLP